MRVAYNDYDGRAGLRGYVQFNKYTQTQCTHKLFASPSVLQIQGLRGVGVVRINHSDNQLVNQFQKYVKK